ncbi:diacylglycerol/lipid kinase family protein [Kordiimonas gwangyangensis]|uniref:diacylglycerol/lipid kinase family protein n=1 Tax=Kordiimonas gwangyangensis TaxID=288022 RepID=UPI00036CCDD4|nr:diacylglycerol kinase family protein [Kordiimonas gwangyangensis]
MNVDRENIISGTVVPLVAIISNPKSTTNAARIDAVRKVVDESPNVVHYELDGIDSIPAALELFARANPAVLIVNGGDGTIGAVLASLLHRNPFTVTPPIAYLPGGKTNMTAADLGFKGRPERVLKKLIALTNAGKLPERLTRKHLIELDMGDGEPLKVGTFFGTAGIVKGIEWCRAHAYNMGLPNGLAHFIAISKLILSAFGFGRDKTLMVSDPMQITVPGSGRLGGQFAVVTVTTLDRLLLRLKPYGDEGKGGLRFSAVEAGSSKVFRAFKGLVTGNYGKMTIDGVHTRRSNEIRIEGSDPVTLDGEIYYPVPGKPITLRGDRTLTFVSLR